MFPILHIGPLAVQFPGLILLVSVYLGLILAEKFVNQSRMTAVDLYNLVFAGLISGIFGARLVYIAQYPIAFWKSPASIISANPALLDPFGGVAIGLIASAIYIQRKGLHPWNVLDTITPFLAVFAVGTGFAHLSSGVAYGMPSHLPWAISLWGQSRHPTQLYEIILAVLILWLIIPLPKIKFQKTECLLLQSPGLRFLWFGVFSLLSRILVEGFRGDSPLIFGGFRTMQIASWVGLLICLFFIDKKLRSTQNVLLPKEQGGKL